MESELLSRFGKRIRQLRVAEGWTQEDLAEHTQFHRTYIGMVERGERNISIKSAEVFARAFNIPLSKLFEL
ncbi:helix-turn-helix domain-containing protein [Pontibacter sp. SGAir0037]|uniref:helix-turn-helix domain-containing protein n=1 Tax=Pontibacter sp. SGAir0037 TaxID=2571030 RepID=UPI0010CD46B5|nr:helix-turn-helix transcriptional regulator [Pontibacter sp. SGAir0037]QCR22856.1 XRE family transcriptional regulator [Pontibacter sp. SGAir0037]